MYCRKRRKRSFVVSKWFQEPEVSLTAWKHICCLCVAFVFTQLRRMQARLEHVIPACEVATMWLCSPAYAAWSNMFVTSTSRWVVDSCNYTKQSQRSDSARELVDWGSVTVMKGLMIFVAVVLLSLLKLWGKKQRYCPQDFGKCFTGHEYWAQLGWTMYRCLSDVTITPFMKPRANEALENPQPFMLRWLRTRTEVTEFWSVCGDWKKSCPDTIWIDSALHAGCVKEGKEGLKAFVMSFGRESWGDFTHESAWVI